MIDLGLFVADESTSRMPTHLEVVDFMEDPIDLLVPANPVPATPSATMLTTTSGVSDIG